MPLYDCAARRRRASPSLYIPCIFDDLAFRVGNPDTIDVVMGTILILVLLEATRRTMGWPLPLIALGFVVYALAGPWFPGMLEHPGATWSQLVNHLYLTSQGIYGVRDRRGGNLCLPLRAVRRGGHAHRPGAAVPGHRRRRWPAAIAGGPAKVSVFGSAMFGMLSGSSVANAVTVGSLTIPR